MTIKNEETPLYLACASLFRILLQQFVLSGRTPQERAAIHADIFQNVIKDINQSNAHDAPTQKAAESIVAAIFGVSGRERKN